MKPAPFEYAAPLSIDESLVLLRFYGHDGKILAGGQSLVPLLNMRLARPSVIIDLNRVRALDYIRDEGCEVVIGAMTRQRVAEVSPVVRKKLPLLAEALSYVGHPQIRNRGTVGGSIAHADPAAELPAVLAALEGSVVISGSKGHRVLRPEEFFLSYLTTALQPDELLAEVRFPAHDRMGTSFQEVARRHGDYALVGVAAVVEMTDGRCTQARLAFTGVGPGPTRVPEAEATAMGTTLTEKVLAEVARIVADKLDPESDIHASARYRKHVAGVLVQRALKAAAERATSRESETPNHSPGSGSGQARE